MKKNCVVMVLVTVLIFFRNFVFGQDIAWQDLSGGRVKVKAFLIIPQHPEVIYFASGNSIFKSDDAGLNWKNVFTVKGSNQSINFLEINNGSIYTGTGGGLFRNENNGRDWRCIFKGKDFQEKECMAINFTLNTIFLGTKRGLFVSKDNGRIWQKGHGELANSAIYSIAKYNKEQGIVYIACSKGAYLWDIDTGSAQRVFVSSPTENEDSDDDEMDNGDKELFSEIRYLTLDQAQNIIYLATTKGIFKSQDKGVSWEKLNSFGLLDRDFKSLFVWETLLYAVSGKGVFYFKDDRWSELTNGLGAQNFNFFSLDKIGNLYVASDKGFFKGENLVSRVAPSQSVLSVYCKDQPPIKEIQLAAIKYAEVDPEKIIQWRKSAAKKALFPKVSVDIGNDSSDLWHWETGSSTKLGDDVLLRGEEVVGWDVTLSWDLGEVIWSSEQTSIDTRSRLMVQLRGDILDEVNKLYFERIRLMMELDNLSIEDNKKRMEKELRLKELAASLDSLTGGIFSNSLKQ